MLFTQLMPIAFCFALASAGSSSPARMAMMAMTTSSSMSVKARRQGGRPGLFPHAGNSDSGIRDLSQDVESLGCPQKITGWTRLVNLWLGTITCAFQCTRVADLVDPMQTESQRCRGSQTI